MAFLHRSADVGIIDEHGEGRTETKSDERMRRHLPEEREELHGGKHPQTAFGGLVHGRRLSCCIFWSGGIAKGGIFLLFTPGSFVVTQHERGGRGLRLGTVENTSTSISIRIRIRKDPFQIRARASIGMV